MENIVLMDLTSFQFDPFNKENSVIHIPQFGQISDMAVFSITPQIYA
jgi:hypothetical protein